MKHVTVTKEQCINNIRDLYELVKESVNVHINGNYENPPKQGIHTCQDSFTHVMPASIKYENEVISGVKIVSVHPHNNRFKIPSQNSTIFLTDPITGLITHAVDGTEITNIRTALMTCFSMEYLRASSLSTAIIGCGEQGDYHGQTDRDWETCH